MHPWCTQKVYPSAQRKPTVSLCAGAAQHYQRHQPCIPPGVADVPAAAAGSGESWLLDFGAGTGQVVESLPGRFDDIVVVDSDHDSIIGYLYSTSYAAPALFGQHLSTFERGVTDALATASPDGVLHENNAFNILLCRRPNTAT